MIFGTHEVDRRIREISVQNDGRQCVLKTSGLRELFKPIISEFFLANQVNVNKRRDLLHSFLEFDLQQQERDLKKLKRALY